MEALGINLNSIIIYTILFVIVLVLLQKYLFPGLQKSIAERKKLIADNVEKSKQLVEDQSRFVEDMSTKEKETLEAARNRKEEILAAAEKEAEEILAAAKKKAEITLDEAKSVLKNKQEKLEADYSERVRKAALTISKEVYGENNPNIDPAKIAKVLSELN